MTTRHEELKEYDRGLYEPPLKMLGAGFIAFAVIVMALLLLM